MRIQNSWSDNVEKYSEQLWGSTPTGWSEARQSSDLLQKTQISLGITEARMMSFLIRQHQCKKFVEIGTLTGASALWILQALPPGGKLWTLEKDPTHVLAAKKVLAHDSRAEVIAGDARETLQTLHASGPFDGIFIDGNKAAYGDYLAWAETNLSSGALIIADNVFLGGAVFAGEPDESSRFSVKQVEVMRTFNRRLANPQYFESCMIPTSEGLLVAIKK